jgi:DNA-directed RNA polymerase alpha subunit
MSDDLDRSVHDLELAVPTTKALAATGIKTIRELVRKSKPELLAAGFDPRSVRELAEILAEMGFALGTPV